MIEARIVESGDAVTLNIRGRVTIAETSYTIDFMVDTGAYATVICPKDQWLFQLNNPDALQSAPEISAQGVGGSATFRVILATLAFRDSETGAPWEYRTNIYMAKSMAKPDGENDPTPELPSLLGMDILRHWIPQGISPSRPAVLFAPKSP